MSPVFLSQHVHPGRRGGQERELILVVAAGLGLAPPLVERIQQVEGVLAGAK